MRIGCVGSLVLGNTSRKVGLILGLCKCSVSIPALVCGVVLCSVACGCGSREQRGVRLVYKFQSSIARDAVHQEILRRETIDILEHRAIDLGVHNASVRPEGSSDIIVDLPGYVNLENAKRALGASAKLGFYDAKNVITERADYREYLEENSSDPDHPLIKFRNRSGKLIEPGSKEYQQVIAGWGDPILTGGDIRNAEMLQQPGGSYIPLINFRPHGAEKMTAWSLAHNHNSEKLACVMDGVVLSIAPIKTGAVITDNAEILGTFSPAYVRNLRDLIKSGSLPGMLLLEKAEIRSEGKENAGADVPAPVE